MARRSFDTIKVPSAMLAAFVLAFPLYSQEPRLTPPVSNSHPVLPAGSTAPDFDLPGIDGRTHKLADYQDSPLLAVMFLCNHCPTSQLYEGRVKKLVADYKDGALPSSPSSPTIRGRAAFRTRLHRCQRQPGGDEDPRRIPAFQLPLFV